MNSVLSACPRSLLVLMALGTQAIASPSLVGYTVIGGGGGTSTQRPNDDRRLHREQHVMLAVLVGAALNAAAAARAPSSNVREVMSA